MSDSHWRRLRWKIHKWAPTRYKLRRRFRDRCESCNHHARWTESWHTHGNRDGKVWHGPCIAFETWRDTADERLTVIGLMAEVAGLSSRDVQTVAALRDSEWTGRGRYEDLVWRAFYALSNRIAAPVSTDKGDQE